MEKKILILSSLVLIGTLYNYPVFDNKGTSFLIIFSCFVIIIFSVAKIRYPSDKETYESIEKETDILENFDGIFEYKKDGFTITKDNTSEFIKWTEIIEINSFSLPVLHREKHSGLEIITETKHYEFNDKQTPGIQKLGNILFNNLPNWKLDSPTVRINNSGLEKTNLYKKEKSLN
ncbi:hypothetical protein [Chryseobacterium oryctis]|uniref:Uncharacterized protein n=1 Tax=Chryseobacterium oryctis TaxID=2952618 RepID=A0ABT3HPM9_9FLAO|nr:hypothetical protein [Chryseobacterium oryctis]MCW3161704.1 hypothetical protein [Chryseobacterium oryctis]